MTIAKDKIRVIFCMADDFRHVYASFIKINGLAPKRDKSKRRYHREGTLSDAEVITMMILFHLWEQKDSFLHTLTDCISLVIIAFISGFHLVQISLFRQAKALQIIQKTLQSLETNPNQE